MECWRICREPFADFGGEGARILGGRWNRPGRPLVYTADTPALAVLEVRVHLDLPPDLIPPDYVLLRIDLGTVAIEALDAMPSDPAAFGSEWLASGRSPVRRVPSAIVPEQTNVLINPAHPAARSIAVVSERPFSFDERLWRSGR